MSDPRLKTLRRLQQLLPAGELRLDTESRNAHQGDKWFATHQPEAVALPQSAKSVQTLLKFASRHRIPVTPRGAGFGYVGGCVPLHGGIALSLIRMNRIKEINNADFVAVVQPGVLLQTFQEAVEARGLYYPPDPASRADCSIGGTIATNAGGPRCLKYGVTRDYVLGLNVVLASGALVKLGARTHKNKTGFDLTRLIVGSEGLLAIVTEATLKLLPLPPTRAALSAGFNTVRNAAQAIRTVLEAGFHPSALEIADAFTLAAARKRTGSTLLDGCNAHLIVEVDGQPQSVRHEIQQLQKQIAPLKPTFVQTAFGPRQCEAIWQLRREFSYSLRDTGLTKLNQDIVVPRGRLLDLFAFAGKLQARHHLAVACFGHAGDGNIHVNIMIDLNAPGARARSTAALDDLFKQVLAWGGSITGEHGIGIAKKRWWPQATSPELRQLHKTIKTALDPHNILNPGKFV